MTKATIELAPKMVANFAKPAKYRVFKGGRGSGKTRGLALMAALRVYQMAQNGKDGVFLCSREHLNSLDESSMEEIKVAIRSVPWLNAYFEIGEKYIRTKNRRIAFVFAGLRHNLDSIKSKARILGNWTDEAESVSETAWRKLIPTIRDADAEIWLSYNPESPESATHRRFVEDPPSDCVITEMNWQDNPWWKESGLEQVRLDDQRLRSDTYLHVWEGDFLTLTDAQVFRGRVEVDDFTVGDNWDGPYQGVDFGFSQDPTAALRCWIFNNTLFIEYEAGKVGLELDDTAQHISDRIPDFEKYAARADSARPESISYLKRHGIPFMQSVKKWQGSVEDGVSFLKSFERIVVHSRCTSTAREFRLYSYKVDRLTGDILPVILDANNHWIDALRYALAPMIQAKGAPQIRAL